MQFINKQFPLLLNLPARLFLAILNSEFAISFYSTLAFWSAVFIVQLRDTPFIWLGIILLFIGTTSTALKFLTIYRSLSWSKHKRKLERPRFPFLSYMISHHILLTFIIGTLAAILGTLGVMPFLGSDRIKNTVILLVIYVPFCRFYIVNVCIIRLCKYLTDQSFRIIVFRRFSDNANKNYYSSYDRTHKSLILPVLGAFGQICLLHNESLEFALPGINPDTENILSEVGNAIKCTNTNWRKKVLEFLVNADLAVFHWNQSPTESMIWELDETINHLPSDRLIFIEQEPQWGLEYYVKKRYNEKVQASLFLVASRPHDSKFTKSLRQYLYNIR